MGAGAHGATESAKQHAFYIFSNFFHPKITESDTKGSKA
jgi:hypothetical protein